VWFDNRFENIIGTQTISFSPFTSRFFNIGKTEARGLELVAAVAPARGLEAHGGYTFLDSEVTESRTPDDPVFGIGQSAFRRPRHSGFIEVAANVDRVSVSLTGVFVGPRVDSDFSAFVPAMIENDGFSTWDVTGAVRLTKALALTATVMNLTDSQHMEPLGYVALGRRATVGVRVATSR
jgi:outer membrane cobalamin receptor